MIVATAGHVDHGKTLLVRQLTGVDTDRLDEEQARGLTIDLGFAYTNLGDHRVGFIDVPGHIRFINNMLAGVSVIDTGMLVIAADDGPMPQTREHLAILHLLGIKRGIVVINKIDRVDAARVDEVRKLTQELIGDTAFAEATIIPVSSITGEGIDQLKALLGEHASETEERQTSDHFRLAVDRCFSVKGSGLVVTGSVFSGRIEEGDEVFLAPANKPLRVRGIHRQNEDSTAGQAGDRLALNLAGADISREDISRGNWITTATTSPTRRFDAVISVLPGGRPLRHWTPVHIHTAANHETGRVATLEGTTIQPGESGLVQLVLTESINVWRGDKVILRDQGAIETLGGGSVIDPFAGARGRMRPERLERLRALALPTLSDRLTTLLSLSPFGIDIEHFRQSEIGNVDEIKRELDAAGIKTFGQYAIDPDHFKKLESLIEQSAETWLDANPSETGMSLTALQREAGLRAHPVLFNHAVDQLVSDKRLLKASGLVKRPGRKIVLAPAEAKLWEKVEPILSRDPLKPPVLHELSKEVNLPPKAVEKLLGQIVHLGLLVRPVDNRYFLPSAIDALEAEAKAAADSGNGTFTVIEFRDRTGIGRNLCIEILEYFDRTGRTVRIGNDRKMREDIKR